MFERGNKTLQNGNNQINIKDFKFIFSNGRIIPQKFSCKGKNINPVIRINQIPEEAECLALTMDDPDASKRTFTHWVMWNIPPHEIIEENSCPDKAGKNGKGEKKYTEPCPPSGIRNYHFKVYALDSFLDLEGDVDKQVLVEAMQGHILAQGELIGKCSSKDLLCN